MVKGTENLVEEGLPSSVAADVEEPDLSVLHLAALLLPLLGAGGLLVLLVLLLLIAGPLGRVIAFQVHDNRSCSRREQDKHLNKH